MAQNFQSGSQKNICFCMAKLTFQSLFAGCLTSAASQEIKQIDVKFNEQIQNSVFSGERKSRGRLRPRFFKGDREKIICLLTT